LTIPKSSSSPFSFALLALIISGEAIFILPFVLARVFRPTVLEVFDLSNLELGFIFSVYGIVAFFAYVLGGPLADKYNARMLIVIALISTSIGGLFLASIPSYSGMKFLFGFWGMTTILLFWAALIRATRELGGEKFQGIAFGFLDGGRGLVSALIGTMTVVVFAYFLPLDIELSTLSERTYALQRVIYFMVVFIVVVSITVFYLLPSKQSKANTSSELSLHKLSQLLRLPTIWLQAVIIICAYVGYKALSDYTLFAKEVLLFNEIESAQVGGLMLWVRPIAALGAGLLAVRLKALKLIIASFCIMFLGCLSFAAGLVTAGTVSLFFLAMISTCTGVFALRALYFTILKEASVPMALTGTAVGFISLIGYTPDIFMGPLMGWLLDRNPGALGHQHLFMVLAAFSLLGLVATILFHKFSQGEAMKVD
jgi:MFS family permease